MASQPLPDKDVPSAKQPEMHTVSCLLAEAQKIILHNHRIIARCRYLADIDVLSGRPSRHRAQRPTLG
jgi:hypothetical protein